LRLINLKEEMKSSGLVGCREGSDEEENQGMWDPPLTENDKKKRERAEK
jgi:hypothetical protein